MTTIPLPREWKEFLRLMISNDVRYMLVGGIAVGYYGYPRATGRASLNGTYLEIFSAKKGTVGAILKRGGFAAGACG